MVYLLFLFGYDLNYTTIEPLNAIKEGWYRVYPFMILYEKFNGYPMIRFHGYYDEPGLVGTISAILLVSDKLNLKNKYNIPILVSGILSLSLFFYVIIILYMLLFSSNRYRLCIAFILLLIVSLYGFLETEYPFLNRFVFENGKLSGDTRTSDSFETWYNNFVYSTDFWVGLGGNSAQSINRGGASYKDIIVNYGFIFFVFYLFAFLLYILSKSRKKTNNILCIFILICTLYQRPSISDFFYLFLWCGAICNISDFDINKRNDLCKIKKC